MCMHARNQCRSQRRSPRFAPEGVAIGQGSERGPARCARSRKRADDGDAGLARRARAYEGLWHCVVSSRPATLGRHRPARACVHAIRATALAAGR